MRADFLDMLHNKCIERIKEAKLQGDSVRVWELIKLDLRILKAKIN